MRLSCALALGNPALWAITSQLPKVCKEGMNEGASVPHKGAWQAGGQDSCRGSVGELEQAGHTGLSTGRSVVQGSSGPGFFSSRSEVSPEDMLHSQVVAV